VVQDARAALEKAPKGSLLVESTPAGAMVTVDGVDLGPSPLLVNDVPAGTHLWRVQLPSGETVGGVVEVLATKQAKVEARGSGADPESRILAGLSTNRLEPQVVAAVKEHAEAAKAELVVFGALSKDGKNLALDGFLYVASKGEVRRLPRTTFDSELLSAGMEFYQLVGKLTKEGHAQVAAVVRVPAPVAEATIARPKVTEVAYGVQPAAPVVTDPSAVETQDVSPAKGGPRTPLEPRKPRAPLRR
jgi:hypothetical protein